MLAALVLVLEAPHRTSAVQTYLIPPGTADKVAQGLPISEVLPQRLLTSVGEELVVRNDDTTSHVFGPFVLTPGQSWSQRFSMAGDYSMTCSLYPTVDLVIEVTPSAEPMTPAAIVALALAAAVVALAMTLAGGLGIVLTAPAEAFSVPLRSVVGAQRAVSLAAAALPGAAVSSVVLQVVALSRAAPWRNAIASKALLSWLVLLALSGGLSAVVALADENPPVARHLRWLATFLTGLVIGVATWPWLGPLSISAALLGTGVGLLGASSWSAMRRDANDPSTRTAVLRLAVAGGTLVLAGIPTPRPGALWLAARAAVVLVAGTASTWWSVRSRVGDTWGTVWIARSACLVALVTGAGLLLWSWLAFVDATSVPLGGNTVAADAESVSRGQGLYGTYCLACHDPRPEVANLTDRQLLEYATWRDADHRFAFRLDPTARGDVVNYLRVNEALPSPKATDDRRD